MHKTIRIVLFSAFTVAITGIALRVYSENDLKNNTNEMAILQVATIIAEPLPATEEVVLPGNVQAWHEATLFARTSGYVKSWQTDMGARVKEGDVLAVLETPELDAQLRQANADLSTAEANNRLAQSTAKRWQKLLKTESVSKQATDEKISDAQAKDEIVKSLRANRDHLLALVAFKNIVAPFDGIVTSRTVDVGTLITEGSTTQQPLFHLVQASPLRIYVQVPQSYAARIQKEMMASLSFSDHPKQMYQAKLLETANAIDATTRTVLAQFSIENKDNALLAGGYTSVHLTFPSEKGTVRLPVNTLLFRAEGLQVACLDKDGAVILKKVTIGHDLGNFVEIVSGLEPGEEVISNPPDSLIAGQKVQRLKSQDVVL